MENSSHTKNKVNSGLHIQTKVCESTNVDSLGGNSGKDNMNSPALKESNQHFDFDFVF